MAQKKRQSKQEKALEQEERQRKFLEKLGFAQMMFDFYTAPVA